jgi:hypothetical protein
MVDHQWQHPRVAANNLMYICDNFLARDFGVAAKKLAANVQISCSD